MGKIWEWFFGKADDPIGYTNSRTRKSDPKTLVWPEKTGSGASSEKNAQAASSKNGRK
jgi:hypothetical protein